MLQRVLRSVRPLDCHQQPGFFVVKYMLSTLKPWWCHQMETFPRYWPFVRGIHRPPVNSPHKGQRHGALMFPLIRTWINGSVNNGEAGDLRRHRVHYDVTVMAYEWPRTIYMIVLWRHTRTPFRHTNPLWRLFSLLPVWTSCLTIKVSNCGWSDHT